MAAGNRDLTKELTKLAGLYEQDPELFEQCSRRLIREFIDTAPEDQRPRMWGLQLRIDAELSHFRDPVARMNRMVELLWDHVRHFIETLDNPGKALATRRHAGKPAKVLPFRSKDNLH